MLVKSLLSMVHFPVSYMNFSPDSQLSDVVSTRFSRLMWLFQMFLLVMMLLSRECDLE